MRLVELFDKTGEYKWYVFNDMGGSADLKVGEHTYQLMIEQDDLAAHESMADRYMEEDTPKWLQELANDYSVTAYSVEFTFEDRKGIAKPSEFGGYGITGTGNQFEVFATVMKAMNEYANNFNVDYWVFSANESSRKRVYDRMAGRFGRGSVRTFELENDEKFYVVQAS